MITTWTPTVGDVSSPTHHPLPYPSKRHHGGHQPSPCSPTLGNVTLLVAPSRSVTMRKSGAGHSPARFIEITPLSAFVRSAPKLRPSGTCFAASACQRLAFIRKRILHSHGCQKARRASRAAAAPRSPRPASGGASLLLAV